jgi:hypothetical protein
MVSQGSVSLCESLSEHAGTILVKVAPLMLIMGALINPANAAPIPPPSGLVSWWPGDLAPLGCFRLACDIVGDQDGLLKGGASLRRGLVATAFSLDGVDDYVLVPDHSGLNFGEMDFTIDLWVNFRNTDGEQVIIEKWIQGTNSSSHRKDGR